MTKAEARRIALFNCAFVLENTLCGGDSDMVTGENSENYGPGDTKKIEEEVKKIYESLYTRWNRTKKPEKP